MVRDWIQYNSAQLVVLWTLGPLFIARNTNINPFVQSRVLTQQPPVPVIFARFNETWIFSKVKHQISWKSNQWEPSCSMRTDRQTDGRTDMTKAIFAFDNFVKAPKNKRGKHRMVSYWCCSALITPNGELLVLQCSHNTEWWAIGVAVFS